MPDETNEEVFASFCFSAFLFFCFLQPIRLDETSNKFLNCVKKVVIESQNTRYIYQ